MVDNQSDVNAEFDDLEVTKSPEDNDSVVDSSDDDFCV